MKKANQMKWKEILVRHKPEDPKLEQAFQLIAEQILESVETVKGWGRDLGLPDPESFKNHEDHVTSIGAATMKSSDSMVYGIMFYVEKLLREGKK